jgi:hypothetical protein
MVNFGQLESSDFFIGTDGDIVDSGKLIVGVVGKGSELWMNEVGIGSFFK